MYVYTCIYDICRRWAHSQHGHQYIFPWVVHMYMLRYWSRSKHTCIRHTYVPECNELIYTYRYNCEHLICIYTYVCTSVYTRTLAKWIHQLTCALSETKKLKKPTTTSVSRLRGSAQQVYWAWFPLDFSSILSNTCCERKDLFSSAKIPKCSEHLQSSLIQKGPVAARHRNCSGFTAPGTCPVE